MDQLESQIGVTMVGTSITALGGAGGADRPVLISGASFAGLATAFWLGRLGFRVTVVEVTAGLRKGGTPVDIEGETIAVLARMGILDAVEARALPPRGFQFKDADDRTLATLGADPASERSPGQRCEIHRDDLLDILFAAMPPCVAVTFGRSVRWLEEDPHGVSVGFDDGTTGRYALIFGCDGNRSTVRRLVFGDFASSSYFMGGYFVLKVVPDTGLVPANVSQVFSVPGSTAMLNGYGDRTDIGLAFRTAHPLDDLRDRARQRRLIHDHFDDLGWKVPSMLAHLDADDDFYFDQVNQIRMPSWSRGRVALVGDAGYCVSPVAGMGGSMALIGAAHLAEALRRRPDDHAQAFRDYEDGLRPFVEEIQERAATQGMSTLFPADGAELAERDRQLREGKIDL